MREKIIFKNSKDQKLVGDLFLPQGKSSNVQLAIFVHGYRSDKNGSKAKILSSALPEKGIGLFVIDLSGRGESEGNFEDSTVTQYIDDLKCAINVIIDMGVADPEKLAVIGSSLGGLVVLQETAKDERIKGLVCISPTSQAPWKGKEEFAEQRVKEWKEKGYTFTESKRFGKMRINYSFYEDLLNYRDYSVYESIKIPVLVLHGTADKSVPVEHSRELIKHIENSKLIEFEGADHNYSKKEDCDKMINETIKFLEAMAK